MALVCSASSGSWANPSWPASELRDTTGNATLMVFPLTPRDEVLALLTGVGWAAKAVAAWLPRTAPARARVSAARAVHLVVAGCPTTRPARSAVLLVRLWWNF